MNKTDLRIRPIYHRLRNRIEGHICICFTAYTIMLELERRLKKAKAPFSLSQARELTRNIYSITYTLPEGFFIQIIFTDLQLALFLLMLPCWFLFKQMTILTLFFIVVVAYYIVGYKQLFGYSLWGTLWRLVFVFCFVYCSVLLLAHFVFFPGEARDIQVAGHSFPANIFMPCFYSLLGVLIMATGYFINWLARARRGEQVKG